MPTGSEGSMGRGVGILGVNGCGIACGHISHGHITIIIAGVIR